MDAELDALIDGFADGILDAAGIARLDARLRNDSAARRRFWERQRLHVHLAILARDATAQTQADGPRGASLRFERTRTRRIPWLPLAAAACLLAAIGLWWRNRPPPDLPLCDGVTVAAGARLAGPLELAWSDGSRLHLAPDAHLMVQDAARGPAAALTEGTVDAAIATRPDRPFAITTPQARVMVLGTGFRLDVTDGRTGLAVLHGRVRLAAPGGTVEVVAGECAMALDGRVPQRIGQIHAVAEDGDDAASGDATHPWRTLARAVRALEPGDTLLMRGTWHEPLIIDRSGTSERPITIRADGVAGIDGGIPLTAWQQDADGFWCAAAPGSLATAAQPLGNDQLLIDGIPAPLSAWPDGNGTSPGMAVATAGSVLGSSGDLARIRFTVAELPTGDLDGAALWWLPAAGNQPLCGRLLACRDGAIEAMAPWYDAPQRILPAAGCRLRLIGAATLADHPGEWCRSGDGRIRLRLAAGDAPQRHRITWQRLRTGLELRHAAHVRIHGLGLLACNAVVDAASRAAVLDGMDIRHAVAACWPTGTGGTPAAVTVRAPEATLLRVRIDGCAGSGILAAGHGMRIVGCVINKAATLGGQPLETTGTDTTVVP